jgi:hypothetical protein
MGRQALLILLSLLCFGGDIVSALADKRVALVIGNGRYVNAPTLSNPPNDAHAIANALATIGFEVIQCVDLDHDGMEKLLRDFLRRTSSAQVGLPFYAGHGIQVGGVNYLVPIDAKIRSVADLNFSAFDLDKVLASLDDPARANIIILDACRDNPFTVSFAANTRTTNAAAGLAAYTSLGTGSLIAFSTAPGRVAEDGNAANSPFTASLIKHIATPGIEVRQMLTRVRGDVALATNEKQVPWDNSSLRGDVYLGGMPLPAIQGPTADEIAWGFLKTTNDASALRHFITEFPKSTHTSEAATRIATIEYALKSSRSGGEPTLTTAPDPCTAAGEHWREAVAIGTLVAFKDHLSRFPNCQFAGLARARIAALQITTLSPAAPQQPGPPKALSNQSAPTTPCTAR